MKFLVSLSLTPNADPNAFDSARPASARLVWQFYLNDVIREMYSRIDQKGVIFMAEAADAQSLRTLLESLPLVQSGQIAGEVIGLAPFSDIALAFQA